MSNMKIDQGRRLNTQERAGLCGLFSRITGFLEQRFARMPALAESGSVQMVYALVAALIMAMLLYQGGAGLDYGSDWTQFHYYNKVYAAQEVLAGRVPWWNPHIYLGRPFFADMETAVLYPLNWVFLLSRADEMLYLCLGLHFVIGYWGMAMLTREWGANFIWRQVSGWLWIAGGVVFTRVNMGALGYVAGLVWLPLALLYAEKWAGLFKRRDGCKLVIVLVLMLLAGQPHQFWTGAVILTVFSAVRYCEGSSLLEIVTRVCRAVCGVWTAYMMAFAISAVQLIPFLYLLQEGNRTASPEYAAAFSMRFADILGAAFSWGPWLSRNHENDLFVGLLAFVGGSVAILGNLRSARMRGLAAIALVGLLVGLGRHTPFFEGFCKVIPGLTSFRLPGRLAVSFSLALIIAIACGGSRWFPRKRRDWVIAIVVVLIAADLGLHVHRAGNAYRSGSNIEDAAGIYRQIKITDGPSTPYPMRVLYDHYRAPANAGMKWGYSSPAGYCALASDRVWQWVHAAGRIIPSALHNTHPSAAIYRRPLDDFSAADIMLSYNHESEKFERSSNASTRAWLAAGSRRVENYNVAIALMTEYYNYRGAPLTEKVLSTEGLAAGVEPVKWVSYEPNQLVLKKSRMESAGIVVVAEAWYPGWAATVDGRQREVVPVNGWMRGVETFCGEEQITLSYCQPGLLQGAVLSFMGILVLGYFWLKGDH